MNQLCTSQRDLNTKQLSMYICVFTHKALKVWFKQHETLHIVYILLQLFSIERAHKGHPAFTPFSKPTLRQGPAHIWWKHRRQVDLVGLVMSGYVHNQIFRIRRWPMLSYGTPVKSTSGTGPRSSRLINSSTKSCTGIFMILKLTVIGPC